MGSLHRHERLKEVLLFLGERPRICSRILGEEKQKRAKSSPFFFHHQILLILPTFSEESKRSIERARSAIYRIIARAGTPEMIDLHRTSSGPTIEIGQPIRLEATSETSNLHDIDAAICYPF